MTPSPGLRERTEFRERQSADHLRSAALYRAGVLICVLLVVFTGYVAATHFHTNDLEGTDHACSLCALAHAGVAVNSVVAPVPVFTPSFIAEAPAITAHSSVLIFSYYIRPPPLA